VSALRIWRPELGVEYAVFPDDEFHRLSATHALVGLAGAVGHDVSENDREVYCRRCDWRRPAEPHPPSWRTADEHLVDMVVPALVDASDLAAARTWRRSAGWPGQGTSWGRWAICSPPRTRRRC